MNKKAVLIIRTVSVEKLSKALDLAGERWPDHPLAVASSINRLNELSDEPRIDHLYGIETGTGGFEVPLVLDETFEAIVFPVGNAHGSGYGNVFWACRSLSAKSLYISSYCQDLRVIGAFRLKLKCLIEKFLEDILTVIGAIGARRLIRQFDL